MKFTKDKEKIKRIIEELISEFNKKYNVLITDIDIQYDYNLTYIEEIKLKIKGDR